MSASPVVLCILDGWGLRAEQADNAVALADTPHFDRLWAEAPRTTLKASGTAVGLPEGQMGNSEVGHTNIGAGRVVWMDLPKIDKVISEGRLAALPPLAGFFAETKGLVHVAGLLSTGGVHAHQRHIAAVTEAAVAAGKRVALHFYTDGRDVAPRSALRYLDALDLPQGAFVATVSGRFYAMDRDHRWERVEAAYRAMAEGQGARAESARAAIEAAYGRDESDEFIPPTVIGDYAGMAPGDGLFFANFRADRAREILGALVDPGFDGFARTRPDLSAVLGMVEYSDHLAQFMPALFPPDAIENTLGQWVSAQGKTQFRLAETEKYPHVTFFLNGGVETPWPGEDRHMPPSPKVRTYDLAPQMAAAEVTQKLVEVIEGRAHDLIVVNFANPDMVGHTGDLEAAKAACAAVDQGVGAMLAALEKVGGAALITADHGNCELMRDPETGGAHTAHTLNPVPLLLVGRNGTLAEGGGLPDLAPTLLALMGLAQPEQMTGRALWHG